MAPIKKTGIHGFKDKTSKSGPKKSSERQYRVKKRGSRTLGALPTRDVGDVSIQGDDVERRKNAANEQLVKQAGLDKEVKTRTSSRVAAKREVEEEGNEADDEDDLDWSSPDIPGLVQLDLVRRRMAYSVFSPGKWQVEPLPSMPGSEKSVKEGAWEEPKEKVEKEMVMDESSDAESSPLPSSEESAEEEFSASEAEEVSGDEDDEFSHGENSE